MAQIPNARKVTRVNPEDSNWRRKDFTPKTQVTDGVTRVLVSHFENLTDYDPDTGKMFLAGERYFKEGDVVLCAMYFAPGLGCAVEPVDVKKSQDGRAWVVKCLAGDEDEDETEHWLLLEDLHEMSPVKIPITPNNSVVMERREFRGVIQSHSSEWTQKMHVYFHLNSVFRNGYY